MVQAAGYVLRVSGDRAEVLTGDQDYWGVGSVPVEPVDYFVHSRRAPLVVFGMFGGRKITHLAAGRRGQRAGTGLSKLALHDLTELDKPITPSALLKEVEPRFRKRLDAALSGGGLLPAGTFKATVAAIVRLSPKLREPLARYSQTRRERIQKLTDSARQNLALQKETLATALAITGIPTDPILEWSPEEGARSFLDGLPEARVREDAMLEVDFGGMPGFSFERGTHVASRLFVSKDDPSLRLTVIMANREPLEEQTGTDLVYFNEKYRAFVMVQYKAMERERGENIFRWQEKAGDKLFDEVSRMDDLMKEIGKFGDDESMDGFRLHANPFFLKVCPRIVLNPDDKGMFTGMYLPLDYWHRFRKDGRSSGPQGGKFLSYRNIGRRLSNSEFTYLVAGAWVGTTVPQSAFLAPLVREILQSGRTATVAIKQDPDGDPSGLGASHYETQSDQQPQVVQVGLG